MLEARIAVIGATGAVGTVTIQLLRERGSGQVRAFASARSTGRQLDGGLVVEEATPEALQAGDIDIAFFSVGTSASRELVPHACGAEPSLWTSHRRSACRTEFRWSRPGERRACPRARRHPRHSEQLHDPAHDDSGAAARGKRRDGLGLRRRGVRRRVELRAETRKIVELPEVRSVLPACVCPFLSATRKQSGSSPKSPLSAEEARNLLGHAPGIRLQRIRRDPTVANGLVFFVAVDNLRRGAALNAIQIAERLLELAGARAANGRL